MEEHDEIKGTVESGTVETKPAEMKSDETRPEETKTAEVKPEEVKPAENKPEKKKWWLLLLLLLLIAAGVGGFFWWRNAHRVDETTKYWFDKMAQDGTLAGKTPQDIQGVLDAIVEEGMFNVSINSQAIFNDGKSEGALGMENIPENRYYARVTLINDEDNSVLYESKGIKPGQYIDKIKLKKNLPAGQYSCTAQIIATDPETLDDIGQVRVKVEVIVVH